MYRFWSWIARACTACLVLEILYWGHLHLVFNLDLRQPHLPPLTRPPPDNWHPVQPPRSYVRCSRTKAKRILKKMPHKQGSFGGLPSESLLLRWGLGLRWQDRASFTWQTVTAAGGAPRSELEQISKIYLCQKIAGRVGVESYKEHASSFAKSGNFWEDQIPLLLKG